MKKSLLTLFIFFSLFSGAQNPLVKMWDYRYGGYGLETFTDFHQTADGGYILGGWSYSGIGGDKTQANKGGWDYWIVKLDSMGYKQWDKSFGGTNDDYLFSVQQTNDGGFILGGWSNSDSSADKTQSTWGTYPDEDYWVVKTDSSGNKLWDRDFGGTGRDICYSIQPTFDEGYILGGYSSSGISGNKTQTSYGLEDFWVVKIDVAGNQLWDKNFGGTNTDNLTSLAQTTDGGYILGGWSDSDSSGNKSQPGRGDLDYWMVKVDSMGNKLWDKDFGGTDRDYFYSLKQTFDHGFILGGKSKSGIGGDKTTPVWGGSLYDFWIIKTDSIGNKQWEKDFGGTASEDEFGNVSLTQDGGYLFAGVSYSNISGDKTENNLGNEQSWIIKTDSLGNKQWDKTLHTIPYPDDESGFALQTRDGCYSMANYTGAGIAGDKTQDSWGGASDFDYWLIKFCDTTAKPITAFTGSTFICPGTCTDFTNLSFNATSCQWFFPGATPDTSTATNPTNICYANPGSYDVQLIATNANGSDTLLLSNYITVYPSPPPQSITQSGDTLFAIAGAANYQWYFNTNMINGATDYFYIAPSSGDYNVVATDRNGCEVEAAVFNVLASAQAAVGSSSMQVFPNPTHDKVTIQKSQVTSGTAIEISIYNMMGEIIRNRYTDSRTKNQELTIDVSQLPPGMYWLEIKSGEKIFRSKFIKAGNR